MENESLQHSLRLLIRQKLADGRLPHDSIPRVWGGPGDGETCNACDAIIDGRQLIMEGIALEGGRMGVQFHVQCFYLWDDERDPRKH
jgi:hypothetical protein